MLAGIGFTMSLFFAGVAFGTSDALALSAKVGILVGSVASAAFGIAFLATIVARRTKPGENEDMSRHSACCSGSPNRSIRND